MENNNNGRGVFYSVIAVATLIVSIIGATFAYFTTQTNTAANAITAAGGTISLAISGQDVRGIKTDLIPVKTTEDDENFGTNGLTNFPKVAGYDETTVSGDTATTTHYCRDNYGNNICSAYTFTLKNTSTSAQVVYFYLFQSANTFGNLRFAVFKGTDSQIKGQTSTKYNVNGTPATIPTSGEKGGQDYDYGDVADGLLVHAAEAIPCTTTDEGNATCTGTAIANPQELEASVTLDDMFDLPNMTQSLNPNEEVTYTVLLWIEESETDQTKNDSGKSFAGGIFATSAGTGTGVTAVLSTNSTGNVTTASTAAAG